MLYFYRQDDYELSEVTLERQALGFGFRIVGGTEEGSQVTVGHIVPGGAADSDLRIGTGDEILSIDGVNVVSQNLISIINIVNKASSSTGFSRAVCLFFHICH